eukprot:COSAG01_NODE_64597_length_276_cov_0.570621_1_plen_56_part_01
MCVRVAFATAAFDISTLVDVPMYAFVSGMINAQLSRNDLYSACILRTAGQLKLDAI